MDASESSEQVARGDNNYRVGYTARMGLSSAEVISRRAEYGPNVLPAEPGVSIWSVLLRQVKNPLIYIILAAALISLIAGEYGDFAIIMVVVIVDVALGFAQEYQAQRSYSALKSLLKPTTTVLRDGVRREVEVWELVPGDLVVLSAGERVPGDGELLEAIQCTVDEAILTGESEPVAKKTAMPAGEGSEGRCPVYMGTTVCTGRALLCVMHTGSRTELGQLATSLQEHAEVETPLQLRLKVFSRTLTRIVVGFTITIFVVGLITGNHFWDILRTAIVLAVAAVPEGLLIAVTVILVLGMRKILRRDGLVKQMLTVETLGSVTVICTDKTGTLTEGRMRVTHVDLIDPQHALQVMALCNNLEGPVDVALWEYAQSQLPDGPQEMVDASSRVGEALFSSETKFMSTSTRLDGEFNDYLKGAPEIVLNMCEPGSERERILKQADVWASEGHRLLGLAYRQHADLDVHSGYTWLGLVAMEDPIREGVIEAVSMARRAHIRIAMLTGDYRRTAERVAADIGILGDGDEVIEGEMLASLSDVQLRERVGRTAVFARIRPQDKLRIVKVLQSEGEITAMIGDGVNDAPALTSAHIGVVVGAATDVAKETADLILLDNNFRTIVAAVEEGRVIFANLRKVVAYVLSNSFAEVLAIFVAMLLGWPTPLLVAQILWIHLICDGPLDIVLGFEPKEAGIMEERPRSPQEPILAPVGLALIVVISAASALGALLLFGYFYHVQGNLEEGRSIIFASFAVNSMIYIFGYRSLCQPLTHMNPMAGNRPLLLAVSAGMLTVALPFLVPSLRQTLGLTTLNFVEWGLVFGVAFVLLAVVEAAKWTDARLRTGASARL